MSVSITFECGHTAAFEGSETRPTCHCGNDRMTQVVAPPPKFRGYCRGPHAQFTALPAAKVDLAHGAVIEENLNGQ